ncbi:hypothetical protein PV326_012290 [Microctonus aethiopoides]|nr:hypothetical protein PV326_012290 [Microctonus aethiopoides]
MQFLNQFKGRHKRDDTTPEILKIRYQPEEHVELIVLKKVADTTLASSVVEIWNIQDNSILDGYKIEEMEPTFYHGISSFSALTYFPQSRTLHGVINSKFYIENLPIQNVEDPQIVNQYIHPIPDFKPLEDNPFRTRRSNDYPETQDERNGKRNLDESSKQESPRKKLKIDDGPKKILYPEIFLVVDVLSRIDITIEHHYEKAIMYVIAYWNAVDMIFRQLKRTEIKINIAGIIIGKTMDVVNNVVRDVNYYRIPDNSHAYIMNEEGLERLGKYFHEIDLVKRDSYDFLIWMTSATSVNTNGANQGTSADLGISARPAESGGMHYQEKHDEIISNRAIVMHNNEYGGYQTAARELAHMMFVFNDDVEISYDGRTFNCLPSNSRSDLSSGIMNPVNKQVENGVMWSFCSEIHLEYYANSRYSCGLFNYPIRTIGWQNRHLVLLTVERQCGCYKLHPDHNQKLHGDDYCDGLLHCVTEQGDSIPVGKPLDGTPCAENDYEDICREHECV